MAPRRGGWRECARSMLPAGGEKGALLGGTACDEVRAGDEMATVTMMGCNRW